MGSCAYAYVGYGARFDEGHEFPWDADEYDSIDDWWIRVSNAVLPESPFDAAGNWREDVPEGERDAMSDTFFDARAKFLVEHPFPVELFTCGDEETKQIVVCIAGSVVSADWEGCVPFAMEPFNPDAHEAWVQFLKRFELQGELGWWLGASYL